MPASRDWVGTEATIAALLKTRSPARAQLLASLADYAAAATGEARRLGALPPGDADYAAALEWLLRPVFICGHQRSGTTLLQNLLDDHPQVLTLPSEGTYFTSFGYVARTSPSAQAMDRFAADWIARFVDPNFEPHFRLGRATADGCPAVDFARALFGWHAALRPRVPPRLASLLALAAAFRATTVPHRTPLLWVEKTPRNERYVARFATLAHARFVHVVRDPRATLASLRELYAATGIAFDVAEHARAIGHSLHLAYANSHRLGTRYLVVRYEDLVCDPAQHMERVRRFLDIAADPTLLAPTAAGRPARANSSFAPGNTPGVVERGRRAAVLSAAELVSLGAHTASAARRLGYDVPIPSNTDRWATRLQEWPRHALRRSRAAVRAVARPLRDAMRR